MMNVGGFVPSALLVGGSSGCSVQLVVSRRRSPWLVLSVVLALFSTRSSPFWQQPRDSGRHPVHFLPILTQ